MESVKVDFKRLHEQLKQRGMNMSRASKALGFADNYFSAVKSSGVMPRRTAIMLDRMFGIKEEQYVVGAKEEPKAQEKPAEIDYDKLYEVVYTAVYQAMKMAWKEM